MIHGAPSHPISLPARISLPPSFPSSLDVMEATASSYAIRFQSSEEIPIPASLFSLPVSRTPSPSHNVTCHQTLHLCASHSFLSRFIKPFFGQSPDPPGQSNVVSFVPGIVAPSSPLTFPQTSSTWLLDSSLHIDSRTTPDGLTAVIVTSNDNGMSLTLDPVCTFTLLYPAAR